MAAKINITMDKTLPKKKGIIELKKSERYVKKLKHY